MQERLDYITLDVNDSWDKIAATIGEGLNSRDLSATTLQEFLESEVVIEHKKKIEDLEIVIRKKQDNFYNDQDKLYDIKDRLETQLQTEIAKRTYLDLDTFYYYKAEVP